MEHPSAKHEKPSKHLLLNLVTYRAKPGNEDELETLVRKHWPALDAVGLAGAMKPLIWKAHDIRAGHTYFVEIFDWKNAEAPDIAHQTPEVMAIWEPMGPILEQLTISKLEPLDFGYTGSL